MLPELSLGNLVQQVTSLNNGVQVLIICVVWAGYGCGGGIGEVFFLLMFVFADALKNTILEVIENSFFNQEGVVPVELTIEAEVEWFNKGVRGVR
jgi:hypothetical protein